MFVSEVNIYPIKSCGGIKLDSSFAEKRGLRFDRRFMLVKPDGKFITQREFPILSRVSVEIASEGTMSLQIDNCELLEILPTDKGAAIDVTVWNSNVVAVAISKTADSWFSDILSTTCRLVYMPETSLRPISERFRINDEIVSFADGYPILGIGEESLAALNYQLEQDVPMTRFRTNLVFTGGTPFAEDKLSRIQIGQAILRGTKPCARCVMTTIDQRLGVKDGSEPLKTLATFRKAKDCCENSDELGVDANAVLFGMNFVVEKEGEIRVGDEIVVL